MCQGATPRSSGLESSDGIKNTRGGTARQRISLDTATPGVGSRSTGQWSVVNVVDVGGQI